jgi:transposase-like protein
MSGKRIPPYAKERILMLSKKGKNYSEISRELDYAAA